MNRPDGMYYLNNDGSRWVVIKNGRNARHTFTTKCGAKITRTVNYFSAFGNFATANISWNGRKIDVFMDTLLED